MVTVVVAVMARSEDEATSDKLAFSRRELWLMVGVLITAMLIRGIDLGGTPYLVDGDEAIFGQFGLDAISSHYLTDPFAPGFHSYPLIYNVLVGFSTQIFGQDALGMRVPSMLFGAFGVLAVYLLGRELFGWRGGLAASLFILCWAYQAHFSRLSLNQAGDPLFAALAFYFLLRGLRRYRAVHYAFSGTKL